MDSLSKAAAALLGGLAGTHALAGDRDVRHWLGEPGEEVRRILDAQLKSDPNG